jgi:glutamine cyclotransferase
MPVRSTFEIDFDDDDDDDYFPDELEIDLHVDDDDEDDRGDYSASRFTDKNKRHIGDHPSVRRQNNCFLFALVVCVLCFAVYAVSKVYTTGSEDSLWEGKYDTTTGSTLEGNDNVGIKHSIGHVAGSVQQHTKGHKPKDYLRKKQEIEAWHNKTVKIADGVQYKVLDQLVHDNHAFTEGLAFVNGRLFESVGLYRKSDLRELDPMTGQVMGTVYTLPSEYFAEGLTYIPDGRLIQLTYHQNTGFIYNFTDLSAPPQQFTFQTITKEGWGMTYDKTRKEVIVSDGSDFLLFWDPVTLQETRRVQVQRQNNKPGRNINELEYWRDRVIANVWYEDTLLVIHPETGFVEKEYGMFVGVAFGPCCHFYYPMQFCSFLLTLIMHTVYHRLSRALSSK